MVELKTTIAQGLHVTDDSAGYDAACKRVLSEKAILARIMKSCLEEYKDCDVNDIAEKYIEGQPQVSAVPVLPDEGGTVISGMDTEDKSVREGKEPIRNYDLLSIIMLCLGGPDGSNYDGVLRMLDVLLSNETSEAEKRKILQDDYDIQMTQTMEREVSVMCNLSKGVEEKGVAKGILSSIKNLMETMGLTIEQAMAALKVPEGERQKYMDLLERQ